MLKTAEIQRPLALCGMKARAISKVSLGTYCAHHNRWKSSKPSFSFHSPHYSPCREDGFQKEEKWYKSTQHVGKTASLSPNPCPFLAQSWIPSLSSLAVGYGHVLEFQPMECQQNWHAVLVLNPHMQSSSFWTLEGR